MNATLDAVTTPVAEASASLRDVTGSDLRRRTAGDFRGDHARLAPAVDETADALEAALSRVGTAVTQVSAAASQIAATSETLASGASEQASSLDRDHPPSVI